MIGLLSFTSPALLAALIAVPAIWYLLRLTPPSPRREVFPPLAILARILKREETPATSPWWLTLLRLALATLVILAMAGPIVNPDETSLSGSGPLVLLVDNDWAAAPDWENRIETAKLLASQAEDMDVPVSVAFTANARNDAVPGAAAAAIEKLNAARPVPLTAQRENAISAISEALDGTPPGTVAFITSGIAANDDSLADLLSALGAADNVIYAAENSNLVALTGIRNGAGNIEITAARPQAAASETYTADAFDTQGRIISSGTVTFDEGQTTGTGTIEAPFELRNDFARISLSASRTAASTYLLDEGFKRRRVGLLTGESRDLAQPLLSPLYYIRRALSPYADLNEPAGGDFAEIIPALVENKPSVIVMADIGRLPDQSYEPLNEWVENGGTLIRFAGPRLASSPADDPLVPVRLRQGERALSGAMSWSEPQPLATFAPASPFAGIAIAEDVLINRQVLAEPSADLEQNTWASLADGTPIVTGENVGAGRIVLFHTSAEATWSNLPLSGTFVEMLRRIVQLSASSAAGRQEGTLPPYRLMDANGALTPETGSAKALVLTNREKPPVSFDNPPGLYGNEDGFQALNLFRPEDEIRPLDLAPGELSFRESLLAGSNQWSLRPALLVTAFLLLIADSIAVLFIQGGLPGRRMRPVSGAATLILAAVLLSLPQSGWADDSKPGDDAIYEAIDETHLAYVVTGEDNVDNISRAGLRGLTDYITYRTALEPGDPIGVDLETDELAFYPIIYWPVTATAAMPSPGAINRIGAYMRAGGTVLFDTRDQFTSLDGESVGANGERLQIILSGLDIPSLEPVPPNHVLTKAFYLLQNFPGRYSGSPLWVEATGDETETGARRSDGVSSIIITGNDLAGAWAVDQQGYPMLPTVPSDGDQREMAFRTGVNIVMYMLTGNYKSDQVHVPALLERLGQ